MNEVVKTTIYAASAAVVALLAVFASPKDESAKPQQLVGKMLFSKFSSPGEAASLEIVRYDEAIGELHTFRVARDASGAWTIPSKGGYPADAENQMRDAAIGFVDLEVLGLASELQTDHAIYGVVEPNKDQLKVGDKGVGMLVALEDKKGGNLASLVIGNKVKGSDDQYFVRIPKQDYTYVVKIDPEKFPTKFESWIEKDLLQLNALDVERLTIKDYEVVLTANGNGSLDRKSEIQVSYDSAKSKWQLDQLTVYEAGKPRDVDLLDVEELDDKALNDLKTAVDDLKIVDVRRKPKGLGADLNAGTDFLDNQESRQSLASRGFYPAPMQNGMQLFAANGEVLIGLKDGVEYVLRFGNTAGADDAEIGKLNRYLFVSTRVDESHFPEPELAPLPELPGENAAGPKPASESTPPVDPKPESPTEPTTPDAPACDESQEATPPSENADDSVKDEPAAESTADVEEAPPSDTPASASSPPADNATAPEAKSDGQPTAPDRTAIEAERERLKKENQRKIDDRENKLTKARQRVRELNTRFADWYYVISEDTYKKIHLNSNDIVKETAQAKESGFGLDAFRSLEQGGLEGKSKSPSNP